MKPMTTRMIIAMVRSRGVASWPVRCLMVSSRKDWALGVGSLMAIPHVGAKCCPDINASDAESQSSSWLVQLLS